LHKTGYATAARQMLEEQKISWQLCSTGYEALSGAEYKEFKFENSSVKVQFNPRRIVSSAAKVDEQAIKNRKCFLCRENLPREQKGIEYGADYLILGNPYPIFPEHFTVPNVNHIPQRIKDSFPDMLKLSRDLSEYYTVFYNGPKCGASAPDHLHFQAVTKGFMPVENELAQLKSNCGKELISTVSLKITAVDDGLRKFFVIASNDETAIIKNFGAVYDVLSTGSSEEEPMFNILALYKESAGWQVLIFPRAKHRPDVYFKEGDEKLLLSPASTEMGGICILPGKDDFMKINKEMIKNIYNEVSFDGKRFEDTCKRLSMLLPEK